MHMLLLSIFIAIASSSDLRPTTTVTTSSVLGVVVYVQQLIPLVRLGGEEGLVLLWPKYPILRTLGICVQSLILSYINRKKG